MSWNAIVLEQVFTLWIIKFSFCFIMDKVKMPKRYGQVCTSHEHTQSQKFLKYLHISCYFLRDTVFTKGTLMGLK